MKTFCSVLRKLNKKQTASHFDFIQMLMLFLLVHMSTTRNVQYSRQKEMTFLQSLTLFMKGMESRQEMLEQRYIRASA